MARVSAISLCYLSFFTLPATFASCVIRMVQHIITTLPACYLPVTRHVLTRHLHVTCQICHVTRHVCMASQRGLTTVRYPLFLHVTCYVCIIQNDCPPLYLPVTRHVLTRYLLVTCLVCIFSATLPYRLTSLTRYFEDSAMTLGYLLVTCQVCLLCHVTSQCYTPG